MFCIAFYHFNSLLLTFITGFCSGIPCSSISHFVETSYLTFIAIQLTGCHVMRDLGVGILETELVLHVLICVCVYICAYMYMRVSGYMLYVCVYVYVCMSICAYVCVCIYIYYLTFKLLLCSSFPGIF